MVEKRICTFCGSDIEPGTGMIFIRKDGSSYNYCSGKCKINHIELERSPRLMKWTRHYIKSPAAEDADSMVSRKISEDRAATEKKHNVDEGGVADDRAAADSAPEDGAAE